MSSGDRSQIQQHLQAKLISSRGKHTPRLRVSAVPYAPRKRAKQQRVSDALSPIQIASFDNDVETDNVAEVPATSEDELECLSKQKNTSVGRSNKQSPLRRSSCAELPMLLMHTAARGSCEQSNVSRLVYNDALRENLLMSRKLQESMRRETALKNALEEVKNQIPRFVDVLDAFKTSCNALERALSQAPAEEDRTEAL